MIDYRDAFHERAARVEQLEREVAELRYVVEKAAEWDAENTENAELAALGAYARAALAKSQSAQGGV